MSILPKINDDLTNGLVQYIKDVKPYHTKILDIDVEYVYSDTINVTVTDSNKITISLQNAVTEVLRNCGWGIEWDPLRTTIDYPDVAIKKAYGQVYINVTPTVLSSNLTITSNIDQYALNVGDPITFTTTGILPRITISEYISPGIVYYITNIQTDIITVSKTHNGSPIVFYDGGSGTLSIAPANIPYNAFDVEPEIAPQFNFVISDINHHMVFTKNYNIIGVDIINASWVIQGDQVTNSNIQIGNTIFVRNNTGTGANKTFTVQSVSVINNNTIVRANESISIQAHNNGQLCVAYNETTQIPPNIPTPTDASGYWPTPSWATGTKILVQSSNQLPYPLVNNTTYYYIPLIEFGTFVLSTTRFPQSTSDIVNISTLGTGTLSIQRGETFYPGATISVSNSHYTQNNGMYYISHTVDYGTYIRVHVVQKVNRITPASLSNDGIMSIVSDGWDYPYYCPIIQADELYTDVFVQEQLWFQFDDISYDTVNGNITTVITSSPGYQVTI